MNWPVIDGLRLITIIGKDEKTTSLYIPDGSF